MNTPVRRRLAALVPAHNEQTVITVTLCSLLKLIPSEDIYVVDDGSKDATSITAKQFTPNVYTLTQNVGKGQAMNAALDYFCLSDRYDYILPMDADTCITKEFLAHILPVLDADTKHEIACVVGKVTGRDHSWVTTYRLWEYEVAQSIHKAAQSHENAIIVCPGCSTVYRGEIFKSIHIPTGTLTEDMDFTFMLHRNRMGRIEFCPNAVVVTQDPKTLGEFIKQINRWYTGFWQCVVKHNVPWEGQMLDFEVALLGTEGLFNGILMISLLFLIPFSLIHFPKLLFYPIAFDFLFFLLPTIILTAYNHKSIKIFTYMPLFYVIRIISCLIFLKSFIVVVGKFDLSMGWNSIKRYSTQEG